VYLFFTHRTCGARACACWAGAARARPWPPGRHAWRGWFGAASPACESQVVPLVVVQRQAQLALVAAQARNQRILENKGLGFGAGTCRGGCA
jgi:hypothetical protein